MGGRPLKPPYGGAGGMGGLGGDSGGGTTASPTRGGPGSKSGNERIPAADAGGGGGIATLHPLQAGQSLARTARVRVHWPLRSSSRAGGPKGPLLQHQGHRTALPRDGPCPGGGGGGHGLRRKKFLTPPHPKHGHPNAGGGGVQNQTKCCGIILSPKMMILQGVGHPISYLGVCYANDPNIGRYGARAYA